MQTISTIPEISRRAKRIGYGVKTLATDAGVHETTVYRASRDSMDAKVSTLQALSAALTKREIELRDYLLGLHPLTDERPSPGGAGAPPSPARGEGMDAAEAA